MSKREVKAARQAALRAKQARERIIRIGAIAGVAVLAVAGIIWFAASRRQAAVIAAATSADVTATEVEVPNEGTLHIPAGQKGTYSHYPPSSGPHWSQAGLAPVQAGVYTQPVAPEQWIHNLEHGYIVVLYNCPEDCPDVVDALRRFFNNVPNSHFGNQKVVISPNAEIQSPIVALAWTRELDLSGFDEGRLLEFYKKWVDTGPEQVP